MLEVGVRELRDGLSRYLATVKQGEVLTVTEHGTPIARIVPIGLGDPERLTLEQLAAEGRATIPAGPKRPAGQPVEGLGTASDLIPLQRR